MSKKEKELEKIFKALANKRRLAILKLLKERREMPVGDIADAIDLSFKSTSRHLIVLSSADLIEKEQRGLLVFYKLSSAQHPVLKRTLTIL